MSPHTDPVAERYARFALREARGVSPSYERFALSVVSNSDLLGKLAALPKAKQQPNLLFAATRHAVGLPMAKADFAAHVLQHWEDITPTLLSRSTQTNEPGRCACLLPLLAQIRGPLALLEVGAAAGLCLLPDQYGYDFGTHTLPPPTPSAPTFPCKISGPVPVPQGHPTVVWRAGLDLNPLDVTNPQDTDWLKTLVWPEQTARFGRLTQAIQIAQQTPPHLEAGDLLTGTEALAATAPSEATLVIFHSAVLNYVDLKVRKAFAELTKDLGAHWIANEGQGILPDVPLPSDATTGLGDFVLSHNGTAIARTGPHGQSLLWFS